jgi:hypothetical protein
MKRLWVILFVVPLFAQDTDIRSIKALKYHNDITEISQSTLDVLSSEGLDILYNQWINVADWNNDNLNDLVLQIASEPTINAYVTLFKRSDQGDKIRFVEDPNYLMSIQGDVNDFRYAAGDFNGDNLIDILIPTENYHGPDGQQPSYMPGVNETSDKLFINTGQGLQRLILDPETYLLNGTSTEYHSTDGAMALDWDFDGKLELLLSGGAAIYHTYNNVGGDAVYHANSKLFDSFEIDANNTITRELVFDWTLSDEYIHTRIEFFKMIGDTLYLAHYKDKAWDINNSIFVNMDLIDNQTIIPHVDIEVLVIDIKKSFGKDGLVRRIALANNQKGGSYIYQDGFHVLDIDNDNKLEFIQQYFTSGPPYINIYDDDGTDITSTWLGDKFTEPTTTPAWGGGNGMSLIDINNDGLVDMIPKDGWQYTDYTHSPPKVDGDYGTFGVFMNKGNKFVQFNIDLTSFGNINLGHGASYFKFPLDINNDGLYEIFIMRHGYNTQYTDLIELDYQNNIDQISNLNINEDSTLIINLSAEDLFGGVVDFSARSTNVNMLVKISNDTLILSPTLNWSGESTIVAYASGSSWKDSTTFTLTVTPINDLPTAFEWVSSALDTINITQENLETEYIVDWTASTDVDGETIDYLLYAKIGVNPPEEIYDTTSTSVSITYQELLENVFEPFPMLPRVTVQFSLEATDGIDTVKITGDNRVLFINRYEYLSTIGEGIPTEFALHENYPNPFNPTTTLRFDLPELSDMTLIIYNMLGQKVKTFSMQSIPAGYHSVTWDATNDYGEQVGAGVYLYQLQTKDFVKTRKMVLLK